MKIEIKNLGVIKQAEFTLGELTIICGHNNTGKTYATHATYGFFDFLRSGNIDFPVAGETLDQLFNDGSICISLTPYVEDLQKYLDKSAINYSKMLHRIFAGSKHQFENSSLSFNLESQGPFTLTKIQTRIGSAEKDILQIQSSESLDALDISLFVDKDRKDSDDLPPKHFIKERISNSIGDAILKAVIPKPFLASAERTGAAIFQKELDFTKNRLVELLGDKSAKITPFGLLSKFSGEYPIAVRKNVDFIRELSNIRNKESFILKYHPDILEAFQDIIGGEYKVSKDDEVQYIPSTNKSVKLSLVESSSAVRSLLDIGFYLRHVAAQGDLLMVDEPELNLHPENQRRVARLFAKLVNIGIKVFITTHSDYILKELNTLIMFNQDDKRLKMIAKKEKYDKSEFLDYKKICVYIAQKTQKKTDGAKRKTNCQTLVPANIDEKSGIEVNSFDVTIEEMNRIQDEIIWGDDQ
ncbi:MAG: ATP-binding protein [Gammaproteobacteria bacterium]|nr:ATP-binding protein [Gammaproteobacteria bacterium]